jgi:hypothetical protein
MVPQAVQDIVPDRPLLPEQSRFTYRNPNIVDKSSGPKSPRYPDVAGSKWHLVPPYGDNAWQWGGDTRPQLRCRWLVHAAGLRYGMNPQPRSQKIDVERKQLE